MPPSPADLLADGDQAAVRRRRRLRQLNTRTVPALRLLGFNLLILMVVLHNGVLGDGIRWERLLPYALSLEAYALATWAVLRRWYRPDARPDLADLFLVLDLIALAATVYVTGADRSWLFFVFLFRVADQTPVSFRRVALFSHLAVLSYLALVAYVAFVEGRPVSWTAELVKAGFLYLGSLYISTTARPAERIRERLSRTVKVARSSLVELGRQSAELERAREEAEAASRAKSEFLSRVSHELRTPMNAIMGFAQLLEMEPLPNDQREHVREILDGGRHLLDIINEVMDIARVETGMLARELEPVALRPALDEVLSRATAAARAQGVALPPTAPMGCDLYVLGQERKLRQVFANLVSNALKYNRPPNLVEIHCDATEERVRISVRDTGPGIPPDQMEAAFTPFQRLGAERTEVRGTGLGLPVARALIEAMGGSIGVQPHPERGTIAWVELTRAPAPSEAAEAGDSGGRPLGEDEVRLVLYIDDKPENVTLVRRILARRPRVELATTRFGEEGLVQARRRPPDLILLDLELPDIPGLEVLGRLREDPTTRDIPVVVVSAEASAHKVERLMAEGARAYFTMPYDVAAFLTTVDRILGER